MVLAAMAWPGGGVGGDGVKVQTRAGEWSQATRAVTRT